MRMLTLLTLGCFALVQGEAMAAAPGAALEELPMKYELALCHSDGDCPSDHQCLPGLLHPEMSHCHPSCKKDMDCDHRGLKGWTCNPKEKACRWRCEDDSDCNTPKECSPDETGLGYCLTPSLASKAP